MIDDRVAPTATTYLPPASISKLQAVLRKELLQTPLAVGASVCSTAAGCDWVVAAQKLLGKRDSGLLALLRGRESCSAELAQLYLAYKDLPSCISVIADEFEARARRRMSDISLRESDAYTRK